MTFPVFDYSDELVNFLRELVQLDSPSGGEEAVASLVEARMRCMGYDDVWRDGYGNVTGKLVGKLPGNTIVFDAHMDVVDAGELGKWQHDPFGAEREGGRIWGRGSTDTKGCLAGMVVGLGRMPREQIPGTIYVTATVGEEKIEGAALAQVIDAVRPQGVVVGEPNECCLGIGQKGRAGIWVQIQGRAAHSSTPHLGVNAIYRAIEAIERIRCLPPRSDAWLGEGVMELVEMISSPFPGESTVPFGCRLRYDRRLVVGESEESVLDEFRQALGELEGWSIGYQEIHLPLYRGVDLRMPDFHPAWVMPPESAWVQRALHGVRLGGLAGEYRTVPYCTNGSYSAGVAGIPTVIFGPSTIRLAHVVDEYIEIEELVRGMCGYVGLAQALGCPS